MIYLPLIALIGLISFAVIASHSGSVGTKLQQPDATIKHDPISLPNGTILKSSDGWGANELTIENGIDSDAVVKLVPSMNPSQASMIVYVRANNTAFLKGISPGSYSLWYMLGSDWSEGTKKFLSISACSKLAKELVFTQTDVTTSQWTITLHPVVNGNASSVRLEQTLFDSTN